MAKFSVLLLTAAPPGLTAEAAGAFIKIDGRECLLRSVELFLNRPAIGQIQLVFQNEYAEEGKRKYGGHLGFSGVKILTGGSRWIEQIAVAADKIAADCTHVIIHDAARPIVPYSDLDALLEAAGKHPAVALASPVRSTLVEIDEGGNALAFQPADRFLQFITPQAMEKKRFIEMAKSKQEPHASEVKLIRASALNIRIGGGGDAGLAKSLLSHLPKPKLKASDNPFEEAQW